MWQPNVSRKNVPTAAAPGWTLLALATPGAVRDSKRISIDSLMVKSQFIIALRPAPAFAPALKSLPGRFRVRKRRSEEHTSELQSRRDLVCRLLLEKKNEFIIFDYTSYLLFF